MSGDGSEIERRLGRIEDDVKSAREEIKSLRDFQKMVMGAVAAVGAILAFVADSLRKKLGLG